MRPNPEAEGDDTFYQVLEAIEKQRKDDDASSVSIDNSHESAAEDNPETDPQPTETQPITLTTTQRCSNCTML